MALSLGWQTLGPGGDGGRVTMPRLCHRGCCPVFHRLLTVLCILNLLAREAVNWDGCSTEPRQGWVDSAADPCGFTNSRGLTLSYCVFWTPFRTVVPGLGHWYLQAGGVASPTPCECELGCRPGNGESTLPSWTECLHRERPKSHFGGECGKDRGGVRLGWHSPATNRAHCPLFF